MKWLNFAYGFLFFANLVFMAVAGFILYRIQDTIRQGRADLLKAASLSMEAGKQLKLAAKRTTNDLERVVQAHHMRDNTHGRALQDLSFQLKNISDHMRRQDMQGRHADGAEEATKEDLRAKLQAELNRALAQNHSLQEELEMAQLRLTGASQASTALQEDLQERGTAGGQVALLQQRTQELQAELEQARERARKAERHAEENASQLDEIRAQINHQHFDAPPTVISPEEAGMMTQERMELLDKFAAREKTLLAQIEKLEQALKRQVAEQSFIEDHFLKMDADRPMP
ncbi:hypothetical protein KIK84_07435 [Curvibacter sp. CHRR-16]|uniref:hypothetical protein n=1 Tax=Curvibacter sp. CHRR-16 TaxID=2835872 RepID=UPI001BDAAA8A|nr:hypothetical protein [Curvibacter sp. CHRR-16]MBT0570152.1 hypothetical protein [Curvibacter sp. CHRR-16]